METKIPSIRKASCVVLLRKGRGDMQVLMAKRSQQLKSFPGLFVFPGGVAEPTDGPQGSMEQSKRCGLRELFEESGVLLAQSKGNRAKPVKFASKKERKAWMKKVHDDPAQFDMLLREKRVKLATDALFHWISFITPVMEPRRFDTDFFVVDSRYEEEGALELDESETVSLNWIAPSVALSENAKGNMPFLPPQFFVLRTIDRVGTTPGQVVDHVLKRSPQDTPLPILPHPISKDEHTLVLTYPGDEEHCDYPGPIGSRHRVRIPLPMGSGYEFTCTLEGLAFTTGELHRAKL